MSNEQQAGIIEHLPVESLKPHPKNIAVYGKDGYGDLVDSIRELGVMQALYVTPQRVIISGHRRWYAAKEAGLTIIPTITVKYADALQERQAIIEFNRSRIKNGLQFYNEGKELEAIEAERNKLEWERKHKEQPHSETGTFAPLVEKFPPTVKTRDIVAQTIGLGSGRQWDKLEYVAEHKPILLKEVKFGGRSLNSVYKEVKRVERQNDLGTKLPQELEGKFNVLYADPPWLYENNNTSIRGVASDVYKTEPLEEITNKAKLLDGHILGDAVLFLWTTTSMLRKSFEVIDAWGFEFKTSMVWVKDRIGTGFFVRSKHEYLLIATRGSFLPMTTELPESVVCAPRTEHSHKPDVFYSIIERMYPKQRYCELYARQKRNGWSSWGNEL